MLPSAVVAPCPPCRSRVWCAGRPAGLLPQWLAHVGIIYGPGAGLPAVPVGSVAGATVVSPSASQSFGFMCHQFGILQPRVHLKTTALASSLAPHKKREEALHRRSMQTGADPRIPFLSP